MTPLEILQSVGVENDHVTADQLRDWLNLRQGATFITIWAATVPEMRKTKNPYFGNVVHLYRRNVIFGANYQNSVHRRHAEVDVEPSYFQAEALWQGKGERINNYMARHIEKGDEYLVYILKTNAEGKPLPAQYDVYVNAETGEEIDKNLLLPFLRERKPSQKQMVKELGCRETFPRTVKINGGACGNYRLGVLQIEADGQCLVVQ